MKIITWAFLLTLVNILTAADWEGLKSEGWKQDILIRLNTLITANAGSKLPVVFDLDDTILVRDIADATFALLVRNGTLNKDQIPSFLAPTFNLNEAEVSLSQAVDLVEYGRWIQQSTNHQLCDLAPNICFYSWVAQIFTGLTCDQVVNATKEAYHENICGLAPFVRPEMAELIAAFLQHDYDVWVISASPVLIARTVVLEEVNPLIASFGTDRQIASDHIIGISTLIQADDGKFYKDYPLVINDQNYAKLDTSTLSRYRLTPFLTPPVTGYAGKVAAIVERIGIFPYFGAGDTLSDMPFLKLCRHKLWMAKLESPALQLKAIASMKVSGFDSFLIQPVLSKNSPCLLSSNLLLHDLLKEQNELANANLSLDYLELD